MPDVILPKKKLRPADIDQRVELLEADTERLYSSLDKQEISPEAKREVNAKIAQNRKEIADYNAQLKGMNITGLDQAERTVTNLMRKKKK